MSSVQLVIFGGIIIFISHLFSVIFDKKGIPDVLLLMLLGILIGPVLGLVNPDSLGVMTGVFTTVTLVIILFEGGLDLKMRALRAAFKGMMLLSTISFAVIMVVVGLIGWLLLKMESIPAFILGATLGGTSSAVVIPMVSKMKLKSQSRTILVLESALSDVLCIVFVLALVKAWGSEGINVGAIIGSILSSFILAGIIGVVSALFWSMMLTRIRQLKNSMFITPAFLFVIYGVSELLGFSGAIAALAFGISLANLEHFNIKALRRLNPEELRTFDEAERKFFGEFGFVLRTFFFLFIGLSIKFSNVWALILGFFITVIIFLMRIPVVRLTVDRYLPDRDLTALSTMVPKGLAAAVLANIPMQYGLPNGELVRDITYAVILISIILTSVIVPATDRFPAIPKFYRSLVLPKRYAAPEPSPSPEDAPTDEVDSHTPPANRDTEDAEGTSL